MSPATTSTAARPPKQDRSRATRLRLLEAAVDCLAELGWSASTVSVVAERAGVSRGAAQHHFPTRGDLFTAAVAHMAAERSRELADEFATSPPGSLTTHEIVERIVEGYTGTLFRAALQLWVASAAEPSLREEVIQLERAIGRETHQGLVTALGLDETRPGVRESVQATLDLARGLGLATLMSDDTERRLHVVAQWSHMLEESVVGFGPT